MNSLEEIAGTAIMVGLTGYVIISILYDPITGRGGIIEMAIATEIFQITYVVPTLINFTRKEDSDWSKRGANVEIIFPRLKS
jgi:hypothetical protein